MRPLLGMAVVLMVFSAAAGAQDTPEQQKIAAMKAQVDIDQMLRGAKVIGIEAGIMGPAVKGQPYSADEIHETNQVLADGTKIHTETKTSVARDSMGRVRRESPGQIMIWDSTAGTSYVLNQSNQTGHKMQVNYMVRKALPGDGPPEPPSLQTFHMGTGAAGSTTAQQTIILRSMDVQGMAEGKMQARNATSEAVKKETLNSQLVEGVNCDGVRLTNTIEAGAIGNDRPIQTVEEHWFSPELQVNVLVRRTDPRTGEDTVRLTNVRRLEPDPNLFIVPPGYQIK